MMSKIFTPFLILTIVFLLSACGSDEVAIEETAPSYVLSADKMTDVLVDLHIVDATINLGYINQTSLIKNKSKIQDSIFIKHKISKADYDSSLAWYSTHLEDLIIIYDNVTVKLNQKHAETQR